MNESEKKLMIINKVINIREIITRLRHDSDIATKLDFLAQASIISHNIRIHLDYANWLEDLIKESEP